MNRRSSLVRRIFLIAIPLTILCTAAQAAVHMREFPPPPPTAKLRVFVLPLTEGNGPKGFWQIPHQEYARSMEQLAAKFLDKTGIYELVPEKDIQYLVGDQFVASWQWRRNDFALARLAGKALYADYVMILERSYSVHLRWKMMFFNMETGKLYEVSDYLPLRKQDRGTVLELYKRIIRTSYRQIFYEAKGDMLATAIHKGRSIPLQPEPSPKLQVISPPLPPPIEPKATQPAPPMDAGQTVVAVISLPPTAQPATRPQEIAPHPPAATAEEHVMPPAEMRKEAIPSPEQVQNPQPPAPTQAPAPRRPEETEGQPPPAASVPPPAIAEITAPVNTVEKEVQPATPPPPSQVALKTPVPDEATAKTQESKLKSMLQEEPAEPGKTRLVVYDFDANERLNVVALILTESLREELYRIGRFTLVNRENMVQVLQELKLQQSGLVDEGQVIRMGKWLAANEAVTGRLAILGSTCLLQAKLTDITTMGTLALGSLKCKVGREEELLDGMAGLAARLVETGKR